MLHMVNCEVRFECLLWQVQEWWSENLPHFLSAFALVLRQGSKHVLRALLNPYTSCTSLYTWELILKGNGIHDCDLTIATYTYVYTVLSIKLVIMKCGSGDSAHAYITYNLTFGCEGVSPVPISYVRRYSEISVLWQCRQESWCEVVG